MRSFEDFLAAKATESLTPILGISGSDADVGDDGIEFGRKLGVKARPKRTVWDGDVPDEPKAATPEKVFHVRRPRAPRT